MHLACFSDPQAHHFCYNHGSSMSAPILRSLTMQRVRNILRHHTGQYLNLTLKAVWKNCASLDDAEITILYDQDFLPTDFVTGHRLTFGIATTSNHRTLFFILQLSVDEMLIAACDRHWAFLNSLPDHVTITEDMLMKIFEEGKLLGPGGPTKCRFVHRLASHSHHSIMVTPETNNESKDEYSVIDLPRVCAYFSDVTVSSLLNHVPAVIVMYPEYSWDRVEELTWTDVTIACGGRIAVNTFIANCTESMRKICLFQIFSNGLCNVKPLLLINDFV